MCDWNNLCVTVRFSPPLFAELLGNYDIIRAIRYRYDIPVPT